MTLNMNTVILAHEFNVFLDFSWRDWSASIIAGSIFSVGAMRSSLLQPTAIFTNYLSLLLWLIPYVYFLNLSNQITGVEEDVINKPDRPIPSGKVTLAGAKVRWVITLAAFLALALMQPSLLPETICWISTVAFLCLSAAGNHWFGKNCVGMTAGTVALLNGSWKAVAPPTAQSERYVVAIAIWVGLLAHIQDLRDIKGDAAVGRKTFPIVFGDERSRWIITFLLLPLAVVVLWVGGILQIAPVTMVGAHIILGWRIMQMKGSQFDHKTYMIYTYIFCLQLALTSCRGLGVKTILEPVFGALKYIAPGDFPC
ncbi:hypothetical protein GALMADRAFT_126848 [Galerina marginata CBS 339.88]|uniref:UbiA prenyltransferase n=1 Tax=Galerina marginata (strain CBS 339.88) TaxID=685588 RepID=A0A067SLQ8_GALM3|nr:hypothetical protein GALMADRAFT_126848 [Galerina marginata CBS 339.88]